MDFQDTKIITIKDFDNEITFKIKLFGAIEGVYFLSNNVNAFFTNKLTLIDLLGDLLKLACPIETNTKQSLIGNNLFDLQQAGAILKNPLSIIDLGIQILEFQKVFMNGLDKYQAYFGKVKEMLNIKTSA